MQNQELLTTDIGFSDSRKWYLSGSGVPGAAGDSANAPVGSSYTDIVTGVEYHKKTAGVGADKWVADATTEDLAAIQNGISWREPAAVRETTATTIAEAEADLQNVDSLDQLDGVTLVEGDRVLLTNLAAENNNVYVVSGSSGAFTLVEDGNAATLSDTLFVQDGTSAGLRYTFNGTAWVETDKASKDELAALRAFAGKQAAGAEDPNFLSTNHVQAGNDLTTAINTLDSELGANITAGQTRSANALSDTTIAANILALDGAIGGDVDSTNHLSATASVNTNISELDRQMGATVSNGAFVSDSNTVNQNLAVLDGALAAAVYRLSTDNVTVSTVVGEASMVAIGTSLWTVEVTSVANKNRKAIYEFTAVHDGTDVALATEVVTVQTNALVVGTPIAGLTIDFDLDGLTVGVQKVVAKVASPTAVNVKVLRMSV